MGIDGGDEVLELTARLVGIDSQNPGCGEAAIAAFVQQWLTDAGIGSEVIELEPGRPNVIATFGTQAGPHLCLCGHLDTKPVGDAGSDWLTDPLELTVRDGLAYGLGSSDMKGAVAAMMLAVRDLKQEGVPHGSVTLLLTADEEQGSNAGAKSLVRSGLLPRFDALVIGEPCGTEVGWESLFLVSRGICCVDIQIDTVQGHSGLSPRLGPNAIQVAARVITALADFTPPIARPGKVPAVPTVNPGMLVEGGVCYGVWPGRCTVGLEIRTVPGMVRDDVLAAIDAFVADVVGGDGRFTLTPRPGSLGWMPAVELDPGHRVVQVAQEACQEVLGRTLPIQAYAGGTDAAYFMGEGGTPTIASLGPGWLTVAHAANERVGVEQLGQARTLYRRLVGRYLAEADA